MAKNVSLLGANYPDVPAVQLPQTGGGNATFYDIQVVDDLTSTSTSDALSAKQGKVLNEKITNNTFSALTPINNRCTVISGGETVVGNMVIINAKIKSNYSATNTPGMLEVGYTPKSVIALSCICSTSSQGNISESVPAQLGTNQIIYIKSATVDEYYDISGVYIKE